MLSSKNEVNHAQIKLISETFVKPNHDVEASKQPYYLGPTDTMFLSLDQMQKGLLFDTKPKLIQSFLDNLKDSLSICLVHFYPLAGRFVTEKFQDEHSCLIYLDCNKGPGARILHATVDLTVSDLISSTDVHPIVTSLFDLGEKSVNHDGHTRPLLSIQVTELVDGVFIGFTMNHSVADGTSLWHVISTLSEVFMNLVDRKSIDLVSISRKPTYKPFFLDGSGPVLKLPYLEPEEFVGRFEPGPLRERIFHFSTESMAKLKAKANEECRAHNISSFQALAAYLWRGVTKARRLQPDEETNCSMVVNYRPRIDPPFSEHHFGTLISAAQTCCKAGEIVSLGLGWAAMLVRESVMALDDKAIRDFLSSYVKNPYVAKTGSESAYYKPNSVLIAGSARFDMYGPEFGLGRAVAILAGYANKDDGKVTANPGREGGGSVDLEVCLRPEIMHALELDDEFMSYVG